MVSYKRLVMAMSVFVAAAGIAIAAQPPQGGRGMGGGFGGGGVMGLIKSKTVIADVKITPEQTEKLTAWAKDFQPKVMETMKAEMSGIEKSEWMTKMPEIQAKISKMTYTELGTVLKPEQVTRLKQIEVQVAGANAFRMANVKEALKITEDQEAKIKDANDTAMKDGRDLAEEYGVRGFGGRPMDADKAKEFDKKRAAITKETMSKIMGTMSADQKKTWATLTGEAIDVAKVQAETAGAGMGRAKKKDD
jgi:Spy/CpxP family protein refolding chaperone